MISKKNKLNMTDLFKLFKLSKNVPYIRL